MISTRLFVILVGLEAAVRADQPQVADFAARSASLQTRLDQLVDRDDLAHSLHFGWFDRPYARATLAIAVKTTAALDRELTLRNVNKGAIPDETLREMIDWCDAAIDRAARSPRDPMFRPQRLRIGPEALMTLQTPPLFGFIDNATATRSDEVFGDLDLLAAFGQKIYIRGQPALLPSDEPGASQPVIPYAVDDQDDIPELAVPRKSRPAWSLKSESMLPARAIALGMASITLQPLSSNGSRGDVLPGKDVATPIVSVRLRDVLDGALRRDSGELIAILDSQAGESWGAWLARRALARSLSRSRHSAVANWNLPNECRSALPQALRATMWVAAIDGQRFASINGWRDLRDGRIHAAPSAFLSPAELEVEAYTALDLLRLNDLIAKFDARPRIAIAIGTDAVAERDGNEWALWAAPLFDAIAARNQPFDVIAPAINGQPDSYAAVIPATAAADPAGLMARIASISTDWPALGSITVLNPNGGPATNIFWRSAIGDDQKPFIALVSLSAAPRIVSLRASSRLTSPRDLLSDEKKLRPDSIDLAPFQVRLLSFP